MNGLTKHPETLPWWQSKVIMGALFSGLAKALFAALALFNVDVALTEQELEPVIEALILAISFAGDWIAARARVTQEAAPPITLGRKAPR